MLRWAQLLHLYQPPHQSNAVLQRVARESYIPIINILEQHPRAKITLNICGSLTEQLVSLGLKQVIDRLGALLRRGQVEFTGSAKYHVILALLPHVEIIRQIKLNEEVNEKYFGKSWQPKGFFIPEMCYASNVAQTVRKLGYQWIMLDEIAFPGNIRKLSKIPVGSVKRSGISVLFRSRQVSDLFFTGDISGVRDFLEKIEKENYSKKYLITACDGENIGHHKPALVKVWDNLLSSRAVETLTCSELLAGASVRPGVKPRPSSWASQEEDLQCGIPYALWNDPKNFIHQAQWCLTNLALKTIKNALKGNNYERTRHSLDQALASDQYWWASAKPWWSPEIILHGAEQFKAVIKSVTTSPEIIKKAEILYNKIARLIQKHPKIAPSKF